jgi:hypothetical protein
MLAGAASSAFSELKRSDWSHFFGGYGMEDQLNQLAINAGLQGTQGLLGVLMGGPNPTPAPQYSNNFGWVESDRPNTRAGPPISPAWDLPDLTPPIYSAFTNTFPDEEGSMDYTDLSW